MAIEEKYSMIYQLFNISYINEDQNENEQYNKCRRDGKMKRDNKMTIQLDENIANSHKTVQKRTV